MATQKKSRRARPAKRGDQRSGAPPMARSLDQRISSMAKEAAAKSAGAQRIAEKFPYNAAKPSEFNAEAVEGAHADLSDPRLSASTLTESNTSPKTGVRAAAGVNPASAPLDRVRVDSDGRVLTTNQGVAVGDNQNSLKVGVRGPALLQDFILREKITHFDHERIPERIVHARGSAAHGYFECLKPLTALTSASLFAEAGKRTPVFVRFSTVAGERGSTDTARDVRGFAVKRAALGRHCGGSRYGRPAGVHGICCLLGSDPLRSGDRRGSIVIA